MAVADQDVIYDVQRYEKAIAERAARIENYHRYYRGEVRLTYSTAKFREAFGALLADLSDNWCQIVVDSAVERLRVQGFRFGEDTDADDQAWAIWQENDLDLESDLAHSEASQTGVAYVLVTPTDDLPRVSVVSGLEAIVEANPADRRVRVGGFKRWRDLDGSWHGVLYRPDVYYLVATPPEDHGDDAAPMPVSSRRWSVEDTYPNVMGEVPLIPMMNNPQLDGGNIGMSDLAVMLRLADAINKLLADMIVASEFVAFPQRWATGIDIPKDAAGNPVDREQFLGSASRLWVSETEETKFGELGAHDGAGYVKQIEMLVQHIAAQTRTPPHYLTAGLGQYPSGDSLRASESGLVSKVKRKQAVFGESWEEAIRLSFRTIGEDDKAAIRDSETIWADPERRTEAQLVDALVKMGTLGVPQEALWSRYGASPQEIVRWKEQAAADPMPPGDTVTPATEPVAALPSAAE